MRDDRNDASGPCGGPIGFAGIAFVTNRCTRLDVRAEVEQGFEMPCVRSFPARQVEANEVPGLVGFGVDFRCEATARAPERLAFLPPFAPAAETWARTMVESNI